MSLRARCIGATPEWIRAKPPEEQREYFEHAVRFFEEHFGKENVQIVFESETEDELNGYRRCFYAEDTDCGMVFEIKENPYFRK